MVEKSVMKTVKVILFFAALLAIAACGNLEWFPKVTDTTPPTISAAINGVPIFNNRTTHITTAAYVTFSANEAATIYYTTNNIDPTNTSASVVVPPNNGVNGPWISAATTILKYFGVDASSNSSSIQTHTINIP